MQQTCSRCGGLLTPGASVCAYCGTPVPSAAPQQNTPLYGAPYDNMQTFPVPGTQYGNYAQTETTPDPYAAQYGQPGAPPPPPPTGAPAGYGQPTYGPSSQPPQFGAPVEPPAFSPTPQAPARKKSPALLISAIVLAVVLLAGIGTGAFFLFKKNANGGATTTNSATTTTNVTPTPAPLYQASLTSDPGGWSCSNSNTCSFRSDGYHIQASQNSVYDSLLTGQTFDNAVVEVKGIIAQGDAKNAGMGIEFHVPQSNKLEGYGFFTYTDGSYSLIKWDAQGNATMLIDSVTSSAIHGGLQQENDLKVAISGSQFTFSVNNQKISQFTDSTYANGYVGLAASGQGAEAIFSNLVVTKS